MKLPCVVLWNLKIAVFGHSAMTLSCQDILSNECQYTGSGHPDKLKIPTVFDVYLLEYALSFRYYQRYFTIRDRHIVQGEFVNCLASLNA
jgi:hypothetical protein